MRPYPLASAGEPFSPTGLDVKLRPLFLYAENMKRPSSCEIFIATRLFVKEIFVLRDLPPLPPDRASAFFEIPP